MSSFVEAPDWSAIPPPLDDGGAAHLAGARLPSVPLPATDGSVVDLSSLPGLAIVYAYPRTGRPDVPNPEGWDMIPGARGCTPQSCAFRGHYAELRDLGVAALFGLSTQDGAYQREAAERLHLPFPLLSDQNLALARSLRLPTVEVEGMILLKRLTLAIRDGVVEKVWYPVFPPTAAPTTSSPGWKSERALSRLERIDGRRPELILAAGRGTVGGLPAPDSR